MPSLDNLGGEKETQALSFGGNKKESSKETVDQFTKDEQVLIDLLRTSSRLDDLRNFLFGDIKADKIERELATSAFGKDFNDANQLLDPTNFEKRISQKLEDVQKENPEVKANPELQNQLEQVKDKVKLLGKEEVKDEVKAFAARAQQEQQEVDKENAPQNKENKENEKPEQQKSAAKSDDGFYKKGSFMDKILKEEAQAAKQQEAGQDAGVGSGGGRSL